VRGHPRDRESRFDWLLIVVPGLIWGASFLFIAEGLQAVAPMGVTVVRIALGFATLSFVPAARRPILPEDRAKTAALGVLWLAFPLSMFPFAEQHVSSALACMLNGATPLLAALVASGLERRAPSRRVALGLAIGLGGAVLIALPGLSDIGAMQGQAPGVLMILAPLVSYAFAYSLARPLQQRNGALPVVWRALGWALLLTAPFGAPAIARAHWTAASLGSLLALGALGTGLAYAVLATAAGRLGATRASSNNFIIPVVSLLLGVLVRHERVDALSIAGAGICLVGAWLIRPVAAEPRARAGSAATS
jgi:drug/metabolite transporter (DMT)-like permease